MAATLKRLSCVAIAFSLGCVNVEIVRASSGEQPGKARVNIQMVDNRPEVRLDRTDELLVAPRGPALAQQHGVPSDGLNASVQIVPKPDGFDMIATYTNNTLQSRPLRPLALGTFTLGEDLNIPDMRWGGRDREMNIDSLPPIVEDYPGDLYAPVAVLANEHIAAGISVIYPILEYKHDVSFAYRQQPGASASDEGGKGMTVYIYFSKLGATSRVVQHSAMIDPGHSRSYTITVRFTDTPEHWARAIRPYIEHFRQTYGPVKYERDTRPVLGYSFANGSAQASTNPDGWVRGRPDLNGYRASVDLLLNNDSYQRYMVWAPSGLYATDQNYPWQFTSRMLDTSTLRTAFDPQIGLPRVAAQGKELGLWWGRTGDYIPVWDPTPANIVDFDVNNPSHVSEAFRQLDLAEQAGAESIGFDAFTIPLWDAVEWLELLQNRYPSMRFVLEPRRCDILNNIAPMYYRAYGSPSNGPLPHERTNIHGPHYLADLLNPGHEIWAAMRWDAYRRELGRPASKAIRVEDSLHAAQNGFIVLMLGDLTNSSDFVAAETWLDTVPPDLQPDGSSWGPGSGGGSGGNSGGGSGGSSGGNNSGSTGGSGYSSGGGGFIGGGGGTSGGPLPGTPNLQRPEQTRSLRTARSMIAGPSDQVLSRLGDEPERRVVTRPSRPRVVVTRDGRVSPPDDE
ncbi:MAG: hypothetical protein JJU33_02725 [Phycisphaerales bacterium]|nr:hypothetical protein [Phycisphaerales bacterium]